MADPEKKIVLPFEPTKWGELDDGETETDPQALEYYKERAKEAEELANYRDARPFWKKFGV